MNILGVIFLATAFGFVGVHSKVPPLVRSFGHYFDGPATFQHPTDSQFYYDQILARGVSALTGLIDEALNDCDRHNWLGQDRNVDENAVWSDPRLYCKGKYFYKGLPKYHKALDFEDPVDFADFPALDKKHFYQIRDCIRHKKEDHQEGWCRDAYEMWQNVSRNMAHHPSMMGKTPMYPLRFLGDLGRGEPTNQRWAPQECQDEWNRFEPELQKLAAKKQRKGKKVSNGDAMKLLGKFKFFQMQCTLVRETDEEVKRFGVAWDGCCYNPHKGALVYAQGTQPCPEHAYPGFRTGTPKGPVPKPIDYVEEPQPSCIPKGQMAA